MHKYQSRGDETTGLSDWKKRAPYRIHEPNEHFEVKYEAHCHCGRVHYQLNRVEPLDSKLCHCTTCQTQHAAPFQWAAIFHKEDINFDPTAKSIEHKLPCKVRCSYCHSPIMDEGRNMILLFPSLIHFKTVEDRLNFKPRCHMFYNQRVIDDSPPELIREVERKREEEREERFQKGENA
ncbi:Mss4-like protein [Phyllosticta citrichinensis]|uniref:Mss4-like protein n=1 Tax=Phyllosticta citrichinensis TaxID=1130410 RepID=A0ABR1XYK3_9PEZI